MENPKQNDTIKKTIDDYNYYVESLQIHAWKELEQIIRNKEILKEHRETIRNLKLTKLAEVGYLLDIISNLNKNKSTELENRIKELEDSKVRLEQHSNKLRKQINESDNLLEQQVNENEELRKRLQNKGIQEEDLELKKQLEEQENIIHTQKVALQNARRELDIVYRSKSPTPSKGVDNSTNTDLPTQAPPIGTKTQEDIINKVKIILTNARKTVYKGYTQDTIKRKIEELKEHKSNFIKSNITNNKELESEFNTYYNQAQEILTKISTSNSPTPPNTDNLSVPENQITYSNTYYNQAQERVNKISTSNTPTPPSTDSLLITQNQIAYKMASFSNILKDVSQIVPIFYGTTSPELAQEAQKFIEGCMLAKENLVQENNVLQIIQCIKTRLFGSAFAYLNKKEFVSIEALCETIKEKYIKRKDLAEILESIRNTKQNIKENAIEFGEKMENLLNEANETITEVWQNDSHRKSMLDHVKQLTVRSFIRGLRDPKLISRFIGHETDNLENLLSMTKEAQNLLGDTTNQNKIYTIEEDITLPHNPIESIMKDLIKEVRHLSSNIQETRTPNNQSHSWNHQTQTRHYNPPQQIPYCSHCRRPGHSYNDCYSRKNTLFCRQCKQGGHTEINCRKNRQYQPPSHIHNQSHTTTPWRPIQYNNNNQNRQQAICYKGNQIGHYSNYSNSNGAMNNLRNSNNRTNVNTSRNNSGNA